MAIEEIRSGCHTQEFMPLRQSQAEHPFPYGRVEVDAQHQSAPGNAADDLRVGRREPGESGFERGAPARRQSRRVLLLD